MKLSRLAKALAGDVNIKRKAKDLLPRPVSFLCFYHILEAASNCSCLCNHTVSVVRIFLSLCTSVLCIVFRKLAVVNLYVLQLKDDIIITIQYLYLVI